MKRNVFLKLFLCNTLFNVSKIYYIYTGDFSEVALESCPKRDLNLSEI